MCVCVFVTVHRTMGIHVSTAKLRVAGGGEEG